LHNCPQRSNSTKVNSKRQDNTIKRFPTDDDIEDVVIEDDDVLLIKNTMLNHFVAFQQRRLSTTSITQEVVIRNADRKKVLKKSVSFHGDSMLDYFPWSKPTTFSVLYTLSVVLMLYAGVFDQPLFLLSYFAVAVIFFSPMSPSWSSVVPDARGTSEMTLPARRSGFLTVDISDPPAQGSKPLNFKYSPCWVEYRIAGLAAPFLFRQGVTPNMLTIANIFYRSFFVHRIISQPDHVILNFAFMWSSLILDRLRGLIARKYKYKYNMRFQFGTWPDVTTLDTIYGMVFVCTLMSFYSCCSWFLIGIFSFGVVFIPMGHKAYLDSLRLNMNNANFAEKVGPGGSRTLNFYEFCGAFCQEYVAFFLLLGCFLFNSAHANNYWIVPADASFTDKLRDNLADTFQVLEPVIPSFLISWVSHSVDLLGLR